MTDRHMIDYRLHIPDNRMTDDRLIYMKDDSLTDDRLLITYDRWYIDRWQIKDDRLIYERWQNELLPVSVQPYQVEDQIDRFPSFLQVW